MEQASAWHCCMVPWVVTLATLMGRDIHIPVQNAASKIQKPQTQISFGPEKITVKPLWKVN